MQTKMKAGDVLNITVQLELDNSKINNFSEIISFAYRTGLAVGRKIVQDYLSFADRELMKNRDTKRYRSKGSRKTCLKTILGVIEYEREVYEDRAAVESVRHVYLLDEKLEVNTIGQISEEICRYAATSICGTTYRDTARQISEITGTSISPQGVWNIVQKMGERQAQCVEYHTELAALNQSKGELESKILYEENDGIWLKLQGKDRKASKFPSKEMKVGIAYDGAYWEMVGKEKRRTLADKVAYASFEPAQQFHEHKDAMIRSRYNTDETTVRVINGDGAQWILGQEKDSIPVLDKFHRNKMLRTCIRDRDFLHTCQDLLYAGDIEKLLECVEAQRDSVEDEKGKKDLTTLLSYYKENQDALKDYYQRGTPVPETRNPGVIHHARLGSMESNVFTLIGNRMKGRRFCWSIQGANHLASLLCAYHTIGFESIFAKIPQKSVKHDKESNDILTAAKIPKTIGQGYEYPTTGSFPLGTKWSEYWSQSNLSIAELNFI